MIEHIDREEAQAAVMADLAALAYYATCQKELTAIEGELPQLRDRVSKAEALQKAAAQALQIVDRKHRKAQADRILSEDKAEQAELSQQIAGMESERATAQAELTAANNRVLSLRGDLEQAERRRDALARLEKPAAEALRAALALL